MYETLPSPSHLAHILSGCKISLTQGWYRWRHDKVLLSLANTLERERCKKRLGGTGKETITYIKEGARLSVIKSLAKSNLLQAAGSWEMRVDIGMKLQFPEVIHKALRPDIVLWSAKDWKIILIDLSVSPAPLSYCCSLGQTELLTVLQWQLLCENLVPQSFCTILTQEATKWELNIPWRDL